VPPLVHFLLCSLCFRYSDYPPSFILLHGCCFCRFVVFVVPRFGATPPKIFPAFFLFFFSHVTPFLPQCIQQFQSLYPLKLCILILCTPTFPPSLPPFLPPFLSAAAAAQAISYSGEVTGAWSGPLQSSDLWRLSCTRTHVHTKPTRERMAHLVGKGGREEETKRGDK